MKKFALHSIFTMFILSMFVGCDSNTPVVDDETPPVITVTDANVPASVYQHTSYTDAGATATDDVDGTVPVTATTIDTEIVGEQTVEYSAVDAAGNTATASRDVEVIADETAPVITVTGANPASVTQGANYADAGATATDNVDATVTVITDATAVNTAVVGDYTVEYSATDAAGNTATASRTVKVVAVVAATRKINGLIRDFATGEALEGIDVSVGDETVQTNAEGAYTVLVAGQDAIPRVVVNVSGAGYTTTSEIIAIAEGANATATLDIDVLAIASSSQENPIAGFTAKVPGSAAQVIIEANTLVDANGDLATGLITADLTPINPALDINLMPGDMLVDGVPPAPIASYGALTVDFTDATGNALNLDANQTATIRIPVASKGGTPPDSIPLFYFDEETGFWVSEGTADLVRDNVTNTPKYYDGKVAHFTTWNADYLYENITITGCVQDELGNRVANALVNMEGFNYSGMATSRTDATGNFTITAMQSAISLIVASTSDQVSNTREVSTGTTNITITNPSTGVPECLILGDVPLTARLTWGENPLDLDTWVIGPNNYRIYFNSKGSLSTDPFAQLDVDDLVSYGPEVFTALKFKDGTYHYAVHDFSGATNNESTSTISDSPARVELTLEGQTTIFTPPAGQGANLWWNVFDIVVTGDGTTISIVPIQTWSNTTPTP